MSLTLFCTSSSVTSTAVQCSSSRGRWLVPFSVTQGWSCNNTYTQKYHSYRIQTPTVAVQSSFLLGHLYLRDGDSSFWVFIQHVLDQLPQFLTYRWPAKKVPQTNVVLTFFHLAIYQEGKCWVDFFFFFFSKQIFLPVRHKLIILWYSRGSAILSGAMPQLMLLTLRRWLISQEWRNKTSQNAFSCYSGVNSTEQEVSDCHYPPSLTIQMLFCRFKKVFLFFLLWKQSHLLPNALLRNT